jgi:hypothetical protein
MRSLTTEKHLSPSLTDMRSLVAALALCVSTAACGGPSAVAPSPTASVPASATTAPTTSAPTATSAPAPSAPNLYRVLSAVPGHAVASPDGRWIVSPRGRLLESPLQLFTIDGTLVRELGGTGGIWSWLPDSSGVFVALMVPQRAPPMGIAELDGRLIATELQLSQETLSRDGTLIVSEHQEGCCVAIIQREIRVARRDGAGTHTLVRSTSADPTPVSLLGIDASDRVVYRDGTRILRIPIAGGSAVPLATAPDLFRVGAGGTSPDGLVIVARGYEPARWYAIAEHEVRPVDMGTGALVEDGDLLIGKHRGILWVGPHALLLRDPTGSLTELDALSLGRTPIAARLLATDVVLAHDRGRVLVVRGSAVVVLDLSSGNATTTGLDLRLDADGTRASALPGGGFIVSSPTATYRID